MLPLPQMSFMGVIDYLALATGVAVGFAIFRGPMQQLEDALRRN